MLRAAASRPPLFAALHGVSYWMSFLGGAARSLFTIASGILPRQGLRTARLVAGVLAAAARLPREVARAAWDMARFVNSERTIQHEWDFLAMRLLHATLFEEVMTHHVLADLAAGAPFVYLDYIAYDEASHRRGPDHPVPFEQLARIDTRVARLLAAADQHGYEVMLVSDHGQASCTPFDRACGRSLEAVVFGACAHGPVGPALDLMAERLASGRVRAARVLKWGLPGAAVAAWANARARRAAKRLEREHGCPAGELGVVTGGSIAHIYVGRDADGASLEDIRSRFPRLVPVLAASPGIGLTVARRSADGPIVIAGDRVARLDDPAAVARLVPFQPLPPSVLAAVLASVVASPTAGDLVVYGAFAPAGAITFDPELGSHGGVHPDELDLFVIPPESMAMPDGVGLDPADLGAWLRASY
jgi:hypothetical protein